MHKHMSSFDKSFLISFEQLIIFNNDFLMFFFHWFDLNVWIEYTGMIVGGKRPSTIDKEPSPRLDSLSPGNTHSR